VLTALTLTAVDPTDGAKATADGVIAWHLPEEDFVRAGSISQGVDILTGKVDLAPGTCYTFEIPSAEASVSDEYAGGLFLAAAGSLLPLTDLTELGVCIGQSIAGAVSYALGSYQPTPPPPVSVYADADYTQFCNDINYEVQMLDAGENAYPRFTPPSEAPTIQAQLQSNPDNANQDPYFQDASAVVCAGRNFTAYPIRGKLYNVHGFTGYVDEWVTIQKQAYFTWFDWSSTYNEGNQ
jgi:hypothetical protein